MEVAGWGLGVEAGAPPVGQEVSVNGGVEETGEGVAVHQRVDLKLGLLVHQVAGFRQGLVDSFSDPRVQTHLRPGETQSCLGSGLLGCTRMLH